MNGIKTMSNSPEKNCQIVIKGGLTASSVHQVKARIQEELERADGVALKFEQTDQCDSLGVQLLIAADKTARAKEKPLVLSGDLARVLETAEKMGLAGRDYFTIDNTGEPSDVQSDHDCG